MCGEQIEENAWDQNGEVSSEVSQRMRYLEGIIDTKFFGNGVIIDLCLIEGSFAPVHGMK
jgi:hypothetical protein